jgi:uncharacterized cupredoxin-like copper-binding protein
MARVGRLLAVTLMLASLAACGGGKSNDDIRASVTTVAGGDTTPETGDGSVTATLKEFSISVSPASAKAGEVHFKLDNQGAIDHEFVVFKSDLDPDKLPVDADGNVDEEGAGVKHIGEQEGVKPKTPSELALTLDAGNYVVVCNLPTHYKAGMHAKLVVS